MRGLILEGMYQVGSFFVRFTQHPNVCGQIQRDPAFSGLVASKRYAAWRHFRERANPLRPANAAPDDTAARLRLYRLQIYRLQLFRPQLYLYGERDSE